MAKAHFNVFLNKTFGKVGDFYTRVVGKRTYLSKRPDFSRRILSDSQRESNDRFREAMAWARKAEEDPELWSFYKKKKKAYQTVYNIAVSDALTKPIINKIDPGRYEGKPGGVIVVDARDKYRVTGVMVSIIDSRGEEIECGIAVNDPLKSMDWVYEAKEQNPFWQGGKIVVTVRDNPGNEVRSVLGLIGISDN